MPQEINKKNKSAAILFWIFSAICMGVIFYFSAQSADISTEQSNFVIKLIKKILFWANPSSFIVRKSAHFLEYTGLCLMLNCALIFSYGERRIPFAIMIASMYSITDEIHQIFVDGRSCQFIDWVVDTCGAITGAIAFLVICIILDRVVKQRRAKI